MLRRADDEVGVVTHGLSGEAVARSRRGTGEVVVKASLGSCIQEVSVRQRACDLEDGVPRGGHAAVVMC